MKPSLFLFALLATSSWTSLSAQTGADDCSLPDSIAGQGSFAFDNSLATTGSSGQSEAACYLLGSSVVDRDVWFSWTADASGDAVISTCTASVDTKIAGYLSAACPVMGTVLDCSDDACGLQSSITFPVSQGTSYALQVGTFPGAAGGPGLLDIIINTSTSNDDCNSPAVIAGQGTFPFNQLGATTGAEGQSEFLCYAFSSLTNHNDVWFQWTADASGVGVISTCGFGTDTKVAAYPGSSCPVAGTALACNFSGCSNGTEVSFPVTSGATYMIQIGKILGIPGALGSMDISILQPPSNDVCSTPQPIAGQGSFAFDLAGASTGLEGQGEALCYSLASTAIESDVWFHWTPDVTGTAILSTCTTVVDTKLALYPGGGCPVSGSALACNDDYCSIQSRVIAGVTSGTTYLVQLGNPPLALPGFGNLDISIVPQLTADDCATPAVIQGQGSFAYDTTAATTGLDGQGETLCYVFNSSAIDNDVWFTWTSNATGPATISTCAGSFLDTKLAAYPAAGCPSTGSALACNDDACSIQSELVFSATVGTSYLLQVGHFPGSFGGPGSLDISVAGVAEPGFSYCSCDVGTGPCANPGAAGHGCANSSSASGAKLVGSGSAVIGADSVILSATGLAPGQPGLYFQGNNAVGAGAGVFFGDGLRCAGNSVVRLGVANSDATGTSSTTAFPAPISVKGNVGAGDLRYYQLWYRDPQGSPCGAQFNLTNGYSIQW